MTLIDENRAEQVPLSNILLPRLMSSKLRIPEIQEAAGETTA